MELSIGVVVGFVLGYGVSAERVHAEESGYPGL